MHDLNWHTKRKKGRLEERKEGKKKDEMKRSSQP